MCIIIIIIFNSCFATLVVFWNTIGYGKNRRIREHER